MGFSDCKIIKKIVFVCIRSIFLEELSLMQRKFNSKAQKPFAFRMAHLHLIVSNFAYVCKKY
jgi:hypothetical protein